MQLIHLVYACLIVWLSPSVLSVFAQRCGSLPSTSQCAGVLPYAASVLFPPLPPSPLYSTQAAAYACPDLIEATYIPTLPQLNSVLDEKCRAAVTLYSCSAVYYSCSAPTPFKPPCQSICQNIYAQCPPTLLPILTAVLSLNCTNMPADNTGTCQSLPSSTLANSSSSTATTTGNTTFVAKTIQPAQCVDYVSAGGQVCSSVWAARSGSGSSLNSSSNSVRYSVYVPAATDFAFLEGTATRIISVMMNLIPFSSVSCRQNTIRQVCTSLFLACSDTSLASLGLRLPLPSLPCNSDCMSYTTTCSASDLSTLRGAVASLNSTRATNIFFPNCTSAGLTVPSLTNCSIPVPTVPKSLLLADYPSTNSIFGVIDTHIPGVPPVVLSSSCNYFGASSTSNIQMQSYCPAPLVEPAHPEDALDGTACAVPCPLFIWTEKDNEINDKLTTVLAIISLASTAFMMLTWLTFAEKRKQYTVLNFTFAVFAFAISIVIGLNDGKPSRIGCASRSSTVKQRDGGACVVQGPIFHYSALAASFWWLIIAIDLYMKVVLGKTRLTQKQRQLKERAFFALGWGFPLIWVIYSLGLQAYGGGSGKTWCFIESNQKDWVDWTGLWMWFVLESVIGLYCMLHIMWALFQSGQRTDANRRPGWWYKFIRPLVFLVDFFFIFCCIVAYRIHIQIVTDDVTNSSTRYVQCLLAGGSTKTCGETPEVTPSLSGLRMSIVAAVGQGLVQFMVYGTQYNNFVLWANWLGLAKKDSARPSSITSNVNDSSRRLSTESGDKEAFKEPTQFAQSPRSVAMSSLDRKGSTEERTLAKPSSPTFLSQRLPSSTTLSTRNLATRNQTDNPSAPNSPAHSPLQDHLQRTSSVDNVQASSEIPPLHVDGGVELQEIQTIVPEDLTPPGQTN